MPRLRHARTGVLVSVDEETAAGLGVEWGDPDAVAVTDPPSPIGADGLPVLTDGAPRGNASRAEWAAFADSLDVDYPEDAKRSEIKAAIVASQDDDSGSEDDAPAGPGIPEA